MFCAIRQQTITWTSVDQVLWHHLTSLGHFEFSLAVPCHHARFDRLFSLTWDHGCLMNENVFANIRKAMWNMWNNMSNFAVSTGPGGGLAPLGVRTSAGIVDDQARSRGADSWMGISKLQFCPPFCSPFGYELCLSRAPTRRLVIDTLS